MAAKKLPLADRLTLSLVGIKIEDGIIRHGRNKNHRGPLAGCRATVNTAGGIDRHVTATRVALAGPLALAIKKKQDSRYASITVEGDGFAFLVNVNPDHPGQAHQAAVLINRLSAEAAAEDHQGGPSVLPH